MQLPCLISTDCWLLSALFAKGIQNSVLGPNRQIISMADVYKHWASNALSSQAEAVHQSWKIMRGACSAVKAGLRHMSPGTPGPKWMVEKEMSEGTPSSSSVSHALLAPQNTTLHYFALPSDHV